MPKLIIEYRTKDEKEKYYKSETYFIFSIESKTTTISITPNETRMFKELIYEIEKDLQDGYHLNKDESFDISEFDKSIMEYEEEYNERVGSKKIMYFKEIFEEVKSNRINSEQDVLNFLERGCYKC